MIRHRPSRTCSRLLVLLPVMCIAILTVLLTTHAQAAKPTQGGWTEKNTRQHPLARNVAAMTYDSARERAVLFGGWAYTSGGFTVLSDETWEWDGRRWRDMAPAQRPSPRAGSAMAYDATRGQVLLFGGYEGEPTSATSLSDTWMWDGSTWTQLSPAQSPSPRDHHAMAYDAARGEILLFGGVLNNSATATQHLGDTWSWDGTTWVQLSPANAPAARMNHAMAYDSVRERTVLFGGRVGVVGDFVGDTWEWDGSSWTELNPTSAPSAREAHGLVYDTSVGRAVLFGGLDAAGVSPFAPLDDTWEWNGTDWQLVAASPGPSARSLHAMAFDESRGETVLFGGYRLDDTWLYRSP